MGKFQNKYRIPSARLQSWDYSWAGAYFITICTKDRLHYFGEIENGNMKMSNAGIIANIFWHEIKHHAKNIELGEFVVMPNHIHGILILNNNDRNDTNDTNGSYVETRHALSLQPNDTNESNESNDTNDTNESNEFNESNERNNNPNNRYMKLPNPTIGQTRFQNQGKNSVSSIIGSYKSAVTKHANRLEIDFGWQTRFYDNIIRDEKSFNQISNYIKNNPLKWQEDKFHTP